MGLNADAILGKCVIHLPNPRQWLCELVHPALLFLISVAYGDHLPT